MRMPWSHTTSQTLDWLGRLTGLETADGSLQTWTLDGAGNPTVYEDQLSQVTSYTYRRRSPSRTGRSQPTSTS
jgi:YD repeat-containing protein